MTNDHAISVSGFVFAIATFAGLTLLIEGVAVGDSRNAEAAEWLSESAHRTHACRRLRHGCRSDRVHRVCGQPDAAAQGRTGAPLSGERRAVGRGRIRHPDAGSRDGDGFRSLRGGGERRGATHRPGRGADQHVRVRSLGHPAELAGATFVASVSAAILLSGALTQWLALIGFLLAAVGVFGIMFLSTLGILVWAVLVGIVALVRPEAPPVGQVQPSPA